MPLYKLKKEQNDKIRKYLMITGLIIMLSYTTLGIIAMMFLPETVLDQFWFFNVFGDESTEGHNYIIRLSDGIDTSEILR